MKNVLITGAAGGIGSAIASKFLKEGFKVYSLDINSINLGDNFVNVKCDVTNHKSLMKAKKLLKDVELSHIISLAGRALPNEWKSFKEIDLDTLQDSVVLNLVGQMNVVKVFYDSLVGESKSIVLMSSINAYGGFGLPAYSAAKSGLFGFMHTVMGDFLKDGVRINTIAPGTIVTDATKKEPKDFDELLKYTRNGRFATKEEVADLAFELCEASKETGSIKIIDEGQLEAHNKWLL